MREKSILRISSHTNGGEQMIFIHGFFFYKSEARHEKAQSQNNIFHNLRIDNFSIHAFPHRLIVFQCRSKRLT